MTTKWLKECCVFVFEVLAGSDDIAVRFTQRQINEGQVQYIYNAVNNAHFSWLSRDTAGQVRWSRLQDSIKLTAATAGADPLSHQ